MAGPRAVVHLLPVLPDGITLRTLTFSEDNLVVSIGRSSKREVKDRIPAKDNAWFESRVMSRDHAKLSICLDKKVVYICDYGSTHGTWLNSAKLTQGELTPLLGGDHLRFGIEVDRGDEVFPALEVYCRIEYVDSRDHNPPVSRSKNTFCVPEDDDDAYVQSDVPSESESYSKEPAPAPVSEAMTPTSLPSVHGIGESDTSRSKSPDTDNVGVPLKDVNSFPTDDITVSAPALRPDPLTFHLQESLDLNRAALELRLADLDWNLISVALETRAFRENPMRCMDYFFKLSKYDQVPDKGFQDWMIMRPQCTRINDIICRELRSLPPDIDTSLKVINQARRCCVSQEYYWLENSPSFKPINGTEVVLELTGGMDQIFQREPGQNLKYWVVDTRKYWIFNEKADEVSSGLKWWIVEKPREVLSNDVKSQLDNDVPPDDRHKHWIVKIWEPSMIGNQWCELAPYWDTNFKQLLSDELYDSYGVSDCEQVPYDETSGSESAVSTDGSVSGEGESSSDSEAGSDEEYDSESDSEQASDVEFISEVVSLVEPEENYVNPKELTSKSEIADSSARLPMAPLSSMLRETALRIEVDSDVLPTVDTSAPAPYHDGPFINPSSVWIEEKENVPSCTDEVFMTGAAKPSLKRSACEMEADIILSVPEPQKGGVMTITQDSFSQHAQPLASFASESQPSSLNKISEPEVVEAISSALSESEPPRKRIKPSPSNTTSLASHAKTAVVSAVLGGLGTIALLASLPAEYFH